MAKTSRYEAPTTLTEAAQALAMGPVTLLAGGTDLMPRWSKEVLPRPEMIVDLKKIDQLRGIKRDSGEIRIGSCTTMSELERDPIIDAAAPILGEAAGRVACSQVRNRGTIGGNLCNASPCADTAIPLILLDAVLELGSLKGNQLSVREVPVCNFFRDAGATVLKPNEILIRIRFEPFPEGIFTAWRKFGTRPAMDISVATVGLALKLDKGTVTHARVGFGSVAPVPLRGRQTEAALLGNSLSPEVIDQCEATARAEIKPISDVRASEAYRSDVVGVMLRRMLERAANH